MRTAGISILPLLMLAATPGRSAAAATYSHQQYFEHYAGTATCLECHQEEAQSFFHSQHYQWLGDAPGIVNADGEKLGKLNTMNDFCTNPAASWIGNVANADGAVVAQGCSKCHAGLGLLPQPVMSRVQLENIDCLICHASGYRRDLYQESDGRWQWKPIVWNNPQGLDSISKRITLPERRMCLRCHSGAGGGPNYKRGDIEYALAECEPDFDVHMAATGNDMDCVACHAGQDHQIRGRGTDLSGTDFPEAPLYCASCHEARPHGVLVLDRHTDRLNCTVCHITEFAKADPTDMVRDWSAPFYHAEANKYSATITLQKDVRPVYAWFNGKTRLTKMGQAVKPGADGLVTIMAPQGDRGDKNAKIHAFKLHRAVLPILKDRKWLVPMAVDEFFVDGDLHKAVVDGAKAAYGLQEPEYEWVGTLRYMGLFHGVRPADKALQCLDCHREGGRMDWTALGYDGDPLDARFGRD